MRASRIAYDQCLDNIKGYVRDEAGECMRGMQKDEPSTEHLWSISGHVTRRKVGTCKEEQVLHELPESGAYGEQMPCASSMQEVPQGSSYIAPHRYQASS